MAKKLSETQLISEELLKLYSPLSKNLGVDRVFSYVVLSQEYYIVPILGKSLTQELQQQIEDNNLTPENKSLILKIAPALSFWTCYLAVRGLGYSFTEKGVTKEKSENSESLNSTEMGQYILSLKEQAEMFTELLIKYLCNCTELYPLWFPSNDCNCKKYVEGEGSNKRVFHNNIYFPKTEQHCNKCNK